MKRPANSLSGPDARPAVSAKEASGPIPDALGEDLPVDVIAAVTLARLAAETPPAPAPSRAVLAAARARIAAAQAEPSQSSRGSSRWTGLAVPFAWGGWAVAAGLALWLGNPRWGGFVSDGGLAGAATERDISSGATATPGGASAMTTPASAETGVGKEPVAGWEKLTGARATGRERSLIAPADLEHLRAELAKWREAHQQRFEPSPGLSRTVVVEMTDPAHPEEAARAGRLQLSERVAESIAAGVENLPETPPAGDDPPASSPSSPETSRNEIAPPNNDLILSGGDGSWSGDIVIEKGLPNTGLLNLPEGTQIRHLDFPVADATNYRGLQNLGQGWFYDQFSNVLWQPAADGQSYLGERAPLGFDAEMFVPPTVVATPVEGPNRADGTNGTNAAEPASATIEATSAEPPPLARGYPIYDETTGSGSIILQNLPAPGQGQAYQLWVTDPSAGQPVSLGLLPELPPEGGRVWFDLGAPGLAPSGYLLTLEPARGSTAPTGRVVLQGP